jgi:hypothetical protein
MTQRREKALLSYQNQAFFALEEKNLRLALAGKGML